MRIWVKTRDEKGSSIVNSDGKEEIKMNKNVFEYGGYHFVPERQFKGKEKDFFVISKCVEWDTELGICDAKYKNSKFPYSYDSFYEASTHKTCVIFRCLENGKLYVPSDEALELFHEPPSAKRKLWGKKNKAKDEKEER